MLSIIVAMSQNRIIGLAGQLPWHLSEDLKNFKRITTGHTVVMGRMTYESVGKPLPNRTNIVLTHATGFQPQGVTVVHDVNEIIKLAKSAEEIFVIGGAEVYRQTLDYVHKIYLTLILRDFDGDTYFPDVDLAKEFRIISESPVYTSQKNGIPYKFIEAVR